MKRARQERELEAYRRGLAYELALPVELLEGDSVEAIDETAKALCKEIFDQDAKARIKQVREIREAWDEWALKVKQARRPGVDWGLDFLTESERLNEQLGKPLVDAYLAKQKAQSEGVDFARLYEIKPEQEDESEQ